MVKCIVKIASKEDDYILREGLKTNQIEGSISVSFETEPSFFNAVQVQGKKCQIVVIKTEEEGELIAFGVRAIKPVFVNGEIVNIGYLSSLRVTSKFRKNIYLAKGYKFLRKLDQDNCAPFYLTTIVEDNLEARKVLESGKAGLPTYTPYGNLLTYLVKLDRIKQSKIYKIKKGTDFPLESVINFLHEEGQKKQFYPYYKVSDFGTGFLKGLKQEDFYIAVNNKEEIVGIFAKWDQRAFKQVHLTDCNQFKISGLLKFSPKAKRINFFYVSLFTIKDNEPKILEDMLLTLSLDEVDKGFDYFAIGLEEFDPLNEALNHFSSIKYKSKIYIVSFSNIANEIEFLKKRVPYLELGAL